MDIVYYYLFERHLYLSCGFVAIVVTNIIPLYTFVKCLSHMFINFMLMHVFIYLCAYKNILGEKKKDLSNVSYKYKTH